MFSFCTIPCQCLFVHLSLWHSGELIIWVGSAVDCLLFVCQHFQTSSFLETRRRIEAKFHVEPPWEGRTKNCSRGQSYMSKMAAMPIYGKIL